MGYQTYFSLTFIELGETEEKDIWDYIQNDPQMEDVRYAVGDGEGGGGSV